MLRSRRACLNVEALESREVPATLVSPTVVTFRDVDGDLVTVAATKPVFTAGNVNDVFKFNVGSVNGSNAAKQQLWGINLSQAAGAAQTGLKVTAARTAVGGDGRANVGQINAVGVGLGPVSIAGDLGRIRAGNLDTLFPAVAGLTVQSIGRFGLTTQDPNDAGLFSDIKGRLDKLVVRSDMISAHMSVTSTAHPAIGSIYIGGSLRADLFSTGSGAITAQGDIGPVIIKGDVVGNDDNGSGRILTSAGRIASVAIGGNLVGGFGVNSGTVTGADGLGPVTVTGSILGGNGLRSGYIYTQGDLARLTVGGSIVGGAGERSGCVETGGDMGPVMVFGSVNGSLLDFADDFSGAILSGGKIEGRVGGLPVGFRIGGSLVGGATSQSGYIGAQDGIGPSRIGGDMRAGYAFGPTATVTTGERLASLSVKGSVIGGDVTNSGVIRASTGIGAVSIGGDLREAGFGSASVAIETQGDIGSVTIGGSIVAYENAGAGMIVAQGAVGRILVKGSLVGTVAGRVRIIVGASPGMAGQVALGNLTVLGQVINADILAGYNSTTAVNADAQIGRVIVGGDWVTSSLVAGATDGGNGFGNSLDAKIEGVSATDVPDLRSRIQSVTIGGQVLGTTYPGDHYGFVAEDIGTFKVGGVTYTTAAGIGNDNIILGVTGDVRLNEV